MEELAVAATRFALDVALKATVLLGITALALAALSRASAAVRQLVAALALAGVLALPGVTLLAPAWELPLLPTPLPELRAVSAELAPAERSASVQPGIESDSRSRSIVAREPEGAPVGAGSSSGAGLMGDTAVERSATDFPAPAGSVPRALSAAEWMTLGLALWSLGVLFGLARLAIGTWRVRRIRRRATADLDEDRDALVAALCATMGLRRPVEVLFSGDLAVPVTAGLARPVVLLPEGARRWNDERIRVVLLHELAHVKRGDWVSLLVAHVATAVYWFHPLAWSVRSSMRKDCERACDDLVLSSGTRASVYAAHLLSIIRSLRLSNQKALPAVAMARRSYWDGRMRAILDPGVARKNVSAGQARFAAAALIAAVGVLAVLAPWAPRHAEAVSGEHSLFFETLSTGGSGQSRDGTEARPEEEEKDCDSDSGTHPAVIRDEKPRPEKASRVQVAVSHMIDALRGVTPPVAVDAPEAAEEPEAAAKATGFVKAGRKNKQGGSWYSRGMDLHNDGRYDEAIAAFERSIADGERVEAATYNIACGYALKGDHDRAFEWLEKAVEADFDVASYLEHDDDLDGLRSDPRYARFRSAARAKKIEDKRDEAGRLAAKYERLRASSPKSGSGFYELGKELLDVGRYDLSAQAFQNAAARGYKEDVSLYNTACALSLAGNRSQALDFLQKSLEAGYDDPGHIRKDEDLDNVRGEPRYRELLKMADDLELHRFDDNFGHKFWRHASRRSEARVQAWREVEQHFADYTRRHPQSGRAWFNLGYARIEAERPAEAAEAFRRSLDLGYRKPTTMYNIACAYALQDRRDEAFAWLNKAMDAGFHSAGLLRSDDDLDNLRGDARFRQALARAKNDDRHDGDDD